MNEWQYLPRDRTIALMLSTKHRSLWISVFSITSHLADFGRLLKTSDFFGNFRKWSCRLQKSQHSEDKKISCLYLRKSWQVYASSNINEGHKPTYELVISFPWQWRPLHSCLHCWHHSWTCIWRSVPPCSKQIATFISTLKRFHLNKGCGTTVG